jgi:cyclophilin family peptidyl-prolyl cis-trans isomerase
MNIRRRGIAVLAIVLASGVMVAGAQTGQRGRSETPPPGGGAQASRGSATAAAGPVIVFETAKGSFEIETYPAEAPKSVEHILALVKRNFYNGQRVHRIVPGQLVQFGDPLSRDMTKRDFWGTGGSNRPIGVGEMSPKRRHVPGAVSLAHPGDPKQADSQMFIMFAAQPKYDGGFTVFGHVTTGMDVVRKLTMNDIIRRVRIKS